MGSTFPTHTWTGIASQDAGFSSQKLNTTLSWLRHVADGCGWRVVIVRGGYLVVEWGQGIERDTQLSQASIDKSFMSVYYQYITKSE